MLTSSLSFFHPLISKWFSEKIGTPTDVQVKAWPEIVQGRHVLVTAPTGCGKTLAAFLWGMNQLITGAWSGGRVRVLYVSPLKALNNDIQHNLLRPLAELKEIFTRSGVPFPQISAMTRSGDTPGEERRKMIRRPPEILITTPESLNLLLSSKSGRSLLDGIATVILDEIHAVVGTKRGTHLITAVDRLVPLCGEFQRIALSATVNPAERVAAFIGGFRRTGKGRDSHYEKRTVTVIQSRQAKTYEIKVSFPPYAREKTASSNLALLSQVPSPQASGGGEEVDGNSWWPALVDDFKKIIAGHRSTLLFANSRRTTEKVTRLINEGEPGELAYAHHGSLAREIRLAVEEKLKRGELKAIVATNSLELGIDIGSLDRVILIQTPRTVSSAVQRIGRSGHFVGEKSRGLLFPVHGRDFVDAAVMARAILDQDIEEVKPVEEPLDVLAQIILSMTAMERWDIDDLHAFLRTSYPYRDLPRRHFDMLLEMLAGRYADTRLRELKARVSLDRIDNTIQARSEVAFLLYSSGGTIPERGYFDLRLQDTRAKIGELDEEFVWERSLGDTFTLGSQLWRIQKITHNDVEVVPARTTPDIIPFWKAEEQNRDFHFSERIGQFLEHADTGLDSAEFRQELKDRHAMEDAAVDELIRFLHQQKEATGGGLPHRHHLLIEHVEGSAGRDGLRQVILHTSWGGRVNRPFALALAAAWEKTDRQPLQFVSDDDAILLMVPHDINARDLLASVSPENVESLLRRKLEQTGFFGARFRENAERALLLPKASFKRRMPLWLIRLRSKELLEAVRSYEDFPILLETWRTCLEDEFDLEDLRSLLEELRDGRIHISETSTRVASPFAGGLIWRQTNKYMYEDDTPLLAKESALRPDLIRELLFSSHLRPKIPEELMRVLDEKLKRTAPGYPPAAAQDLLDWIKERMLIPEAEWKELAAAIRRDHGADPQEWLQTNAKKLVWISLPDAATPFLAGVEILPRVLAAFRLRPIDLPLKPVAANEDAEGLKRSVLKFLREVSAGPHAAAAPEDYDLSGFLSEWLAYYGPMEKTRLQELLGVTQERLDEAIEPLIEAQGLIMDRFGEQSRLLEICDSENLEMLLRMARRFRQPSFVALPLEQLSHFLAVFQGVVSRGETLDDLQQRLEQLFGWPARAEAWEEYLLPSRMQPYRGEWLDSLMTTTDLVWFGCGRQRISLAFVRDLELFRLLDQDDHPDAGGRDLSELEKLIPDSRGRFSFFEIAEFSHLDSTAVSERLWRQAWKGNVTTDTFRTISKGALNKFAAQSFSDEARLSSRRSGFNRWKVSRPMEGHWRRIDAPDKAGDILEEEELKKDRARQLLRRYGVLFRELLTNELPPLQWRAVFRSLRLMELSGEVLSGYFFKGASGPQFISHEAFRVLQGPLPQDAVYGVSAADPVSLCGLFPATEPALPPRIASTHLVYHGSRLVLISKRLGKSLEIFVGPEDAHLSDYLSLFKDLLSREFNPVHKISVVTANGDPVLHSPYAQALKQFGFRSSKNALEIWKEY